MPLGATNLPFSVSFHERRMAISRAEISYTVVEASVSCPFVAFGHPLRSGVYSSMILSWNGGCWELCNGKRIPNSSGKTRKNEKTVKPPTTQTSQTWRNNLWQIDRSAKYQSDMTEQSLANRQKRHISFLETRFLQISDFTAASPSCCALCGIKEPL